MDWTIRTANLEDCKDIRRMMSELSEYEKVADQVTITQKDLEQDGFSKNPFFHALIAEIPEQNKTKDGHTKIGFSMYFYTYSSWKGRAVYMEDLYVMPEFRGKGIGKALMSKVAQMGRTAGCTQLNFTVLNWNKTALDFYLNQGSMDVTSDLGYHYMCCHGDAFQNMADNEF
ncbi:thialysine N-epsilon-acetyltransferase-like [Tachysurus fulvidraco]|uniref:thialysine N-epsilon-acetyltransferase-like n=1 Tax=Tachysurus fulvidraco TaxID=1234273 RepID=UPI001FEFA31C|nr:thialysine N-epsilon-acetyltransferase-like [Tachysurus fulvidraco]